MLLLLPSVLMAWLALGRWQPRIKNQEFSCCCCCCGGLFSDRAPWVDQGIRLIKCFALFCSLCRGGRCYSAAAVRLDARDATACGHGHTHQYAIDPICPFSCGLCQEVGQHVNVQRLQETRGNFGGGVAEGVFDWSGSATIVYITYVPWILCILFQLGTSQLFCFVLFLGSSYLFITLADARYYCTCTKGYVCM